MTRLIKHRFVLTAGFFAASFAICLYLSRPAPTNAQLTGRSGLSQADLRLIVAQAIAAAETTNSPLRSLPGNPRNTRMQIAVVGRDGKLLLHTGMPDAWVGSIDIA